MKNKFELLSGSTFVWIACLLLIVNLVAPGLHPLADVPHDELQPLQLSKNALNFKMDRLNELAGAPEILFMGSSLPMCALYYSDGKAQSSSLAELAKTQGVNFMQSYTGAEYFQNLLKARLSRSPEIFNFTSAACMMSDANLILSRITGSGKKPRILILCVGLRDFVDNINPPVGETPAFQALCDARYLKENLKTALEARTFNDLVVGAVFPAYKERGDYRMLVEYLLCKQFDRRNSVEMAYFLMEKAAQSQTRTAPQSPTGAHKTNDTSNTSDTHKALHPTSVPPSTTDVAVLNPAAKSPPTAAPSPDPEPNPLDYEKRYNPPNYKKMDLEMKQLAAILSACASNGVRVALVNMPVSEGNKRLSPPGLRETYIFGLKEQSRKTGATFIDFEDSSAFENKDFLDTAHLGGSGARKFLELLSAELASKWCL